MDTKPIRVFLYKFDLERIAELSNFIEINISYIRNDANVDKITLEGNKLDTELVQNLKETSFVGIEFYKNGFYREIYFAKIIEFSKITDNNRNTNLQIKILHASKYYLSSRYISKNYASVEESEIVTDMLAETNNDTKGGIFTKEQVELNIAVGSIDKTNNIRTKNYTNKEIYKGIQELANLRDIGGNPQRNRGFIFTPSLTIPRSTDSVWTDLIYRSSLGETKKNIIYTDPLINSIKTIQSIKDYSNYVNAVNNGVTGSDLTTTNSLREALKMREQYTSVRNVSTQAELEDFASEIVSLNSEPTVIRSIELVENDPFLGDFFIGDLIRVIYSDEWDSIDEFLLVFEIKLTIDKDLNIRSSYTLASTRQSSNATTDTERLINRLNENTQTITEIQK